MEKNGVETYTKIRDLVATATAATRAVLVDFLRVGRAQVLHFADGLLHSVLGGWSIHRFGLLGLGRLLLVRNRCGFVTEFS